MKLHPEAIQDTFSTLPLSFRASGKARPAFFDPGPLPQLLLSPTAEKVLNAGLGALALALVAPAGETALPAIIGAFVALAAFAMFQRIGFADIRRPGRLRTAQLLARTTTIALLSGAAVATAGAMLLAPAINPLTYAFLVLGFAVPSGAFRTLAARRPLARSGMPVRLALVGDGDTSAAVERALSGPPGTRCAVVLRLPDDNQDGLDQLRRLALNGRLDAIVLVTAGQPIEHIRRTCSAIADLPVSICLAGDPALFDHGALSLGRWTGRHWPRSPLLEVFPPPPAGLAQHAKRGLDIAVAALALLLLAPAMALIALAIRLETPGPVLFRQLRSGLGGRPVEVLKFRTMRVEQCDPSGAQRTVSRDPRVTRLGRLLRRSSFDELPQLWNVLRGDMSLVGPRPHALAMRIGDVSYTDAVPFYRLRHRVRPGITGWAQVNGSRGEVGTQEKAARRVRLDLWYIGNWSLALDFQILLRTVFGGFASFDAD